MTVSLSWVGRPVGVTLAWAGLPPNVDGGTPRIIPEGVTTQGMTLSVPTSVPFGEATVQLVATSTAPGFGQVVIDVPLLVRGNPGELDTSFGEDGNVQLPQAKYGAISMMVDSQSRLLVTGQSEEVDDGVSQGLVVARYGPNGMLDNSFGASGVVKWSPPYAGVFAPASNDQLPQSTVETASGYRVAFKFINPVGRVALSDVAANGAVGVSPAAPAALQTFSPASTLPEGDAAIFSLNESCSLGKQDATGALDGPWSTAAQLTPQLAPPDQYCLQTLLAASATRLLVYVRASLNGVEPAWNGISVIDRQTGASIARLEVTEQIVAGVALAANKFAAFGLSGASTFVDSAGAKTQGQGVEVAAQARISAANLANGNVGVLVTEQPSHATALHTLDGSGARVGVALPLPAPDVTDAGNVRPTYAYQAFEDGRRRLVVFHRASFDAVASSPLANPHWVIRRYWL